MGVAVGHFIWRIAPDHTALVIAGTGLQGTPGDGQQALAADLGAPAGLRWTVRIASMSPTPAITWSCGSRRMAG